MNSKAKKKMLGSWQSQKERERDVPFSHQSQWGKKDQTFVTDKDGESHSFLQQNKITKIRHWRRMSLLSLVELLGTPQPVHLARNTLSSPTKPFASTSHHLIRVYSYTSSAGLDTWTCLASVLSFPFRSIPNHNKLPLLRAINCLRFCSVIITTNYFGC